LRFDGGQKDDGRLTWSEISLLTDHASPVLTINFQLSLSPGLPVVSRRRPQRAAARGELSRLVSLVLCVDAGVFDGQLASLQGLKSFRHRVECLLHRGGDHVGDKIQVGEGHGVALHAAIGKSM